MKNINKEELNTIRMLLIDKVIRNYEIMNNNFVRGENNSDLDLIELIVDLYELLHIAVTGDTYDYFFHWANKIGSWVDTGNCLKIVRERLDEFYSKELKL